ncbi:MAG: GNAT family N-acetyltransferase [Novosphingobium sp.]|nr:GNAT family N-acetyltransferase [Novosphingobium sp.]
MASKPEFSWLEGGFSQTAGWSLPAGEITCVPWREMSREIDGWDQLALDAAEPNPFFESWYLLSSLEALDGKDDISILRFEQDGRLRGLMPIQHESKYFSWPIPHLSNWVHANCFLGTPLVANCSEVAFWQAMLSWADEHPGPALFLHLNAFSLRGPLSIGLETVLRDEKRPWGIVKRDDRAMLESDLGAEDYLAAALSKQKRKDLRRRFNRLRELGDVRFVWENTSSNISTWIDQFLKLEATGWKGEQGSALACDQATAAIFRNSLTGAAERGRLMRLALLLDDKPIAMLANFVTPPGTFGYKTAFDEDHAKFSLNSP